MSTVTRSAGPRARALALALSLAAAGGAAPALAGPAGHGAAADIGKPGDAASVDRTIEIVMGDNYYEPETVAVAPGETVRFAIRNEGVFVHEFAIGTPMMHKGHRAEMTMMMEHGVLEPDRINRERMKMDMGGGRTMEHSSPNSVLVEPGDAAEVIWTFGAAADLEFACNVPGHYESGMVGPVLLRPADS
ncbi:MAG: plastocyanin/azurin family copper-binding protein [Alphaproteobacteria bacterium]|nr:plastocyanin/azurin family copper-binding protein [Alphaproteobacteria bacterium]